MPSAQSAKVLIKKFRLPLDPHSLIAGLMLSGHVVMREYESTTGSGEVKHFHVLCDHAAHLGKNAASGWHEFKTEIKFFEEQFGSTYILACTAIANDARKQFPS